MHLDRYFLHPKSKVESHVWWICSLSYSLSPSFFCSGNGFHFGCGGFSFLYVRVGGWLYSCYVIVINLFYNFYCCHFMTQCYTAARPVILEPIMLVELKAPIEFQGTVTGDINKWVYFLTCHNTVSSTCSSTSWTYNFHLFYNRRKGVIVGNDQDGDDSVITAHVCITLLVLSYHKII